MDYAHAQRVLSDLLLRRSLSSSYPEQDRRSASLQFEVRPLDPFGNPLQAWADPGPPPIASPVLGIGIGGSEGDQNLTLLYEAGAGHFDFDSLIAKTGFAGLQFEPFPTGRIVANARPAEGGDSLGHVNGDTGTFGCLVQNSSNEQFLLSCNHVIANLNAGIKGSDAIWQPGKKDGGSAKSRIGVLHDFAYITLGGATGNRIDAALCKPDTASDASANVRRIGALVGTAIGTLGMKVRKSGAKTRVTNGKVRLRNLSVLVDYPSGSQALFDGQLGIISTSSGNFSQQGDSGSVVVDDSNAVVGLVISSVSGVDLTIANPIQDVLTHFGVTIC